MNLEAFAWGRRAGAEPERMAALMGQVKEPTESRHLSQTLDEIVLNPVSWYEENGITLHLGKKVVEIDRRRRIVRAEDGTEAEYDRLLQKGLAVRPVRGGIRVTIRTPQDDDRLLQTLA